MTPPAPRPLEWMKAELDEHMDVYRVFLEKERDARVRADVTWALLIAIRRELRRHGIVVEMPRRETRQEARERLSR